MPTKKPQKEPELDHEQSPTNDPRLDDELVSEVKAAEPPFKDPTQELEADETRRLAKEKMYAKDVYDKDGFHITWTMMGAIQDRYIQDTAGGGGATTDATRYVASKEEGYNTPIFIVIRPCELVYISTWWDNNGNTGTYSFEKLTSTQAASGGTNILTTSQSIASGALTVVNHDFTDPAVTTNQSSLQFDKGDRLGLVASNDWEGMQTFIVTAYFIYRDNGDYHGIS